MKEKERGREREYLVYIVSNIHKFIGLVKFLVNKKRERERERGIERERDKEKDKRD